MKIVFDGGRNDTIGRGRGKLIQREEMSKLSAVRWDFFYIPRVFHKGLREGGADSPHLVGAVKQHKGGYRFG